MTRPTLSEALTILACVGMAFEACRAPASPSTGDTLHDLALAIEVAESRTKDYDNYFYNIALAYGSRQEMISAIKRIACKVKDGELVVDDIDEKTVSSFLYTADFKDPDLVLRTSGEERVSNFLLWQLAYSELYFTDVFWPGFRKVDFLRAIRTYQARQRRFGK